MKLDKIMIKDLKNIVVISPHPDDETLGVGGTIKKFSKQGVDVSVLVISGIFHHYIH